MKKFLFAIMIVSSICLTIFPEEIYNREDPEKVDIHGTHNGEQNNNSRSISCCTAFYHSSTSELEVNTLGVGAADVFLFDSTNRIVASDSISGHGQEQVVLDVPSRSGEYVVIITSSEYFGEGAFVK